MEKILKKILPTEEEKKKLKEVEEKICKSLLEMGKKHEVCGSYARETFTRGNNEMDIFIFYPEDFPESQFKDEIIKIGEKLKRKKIIEDYEINYASHPYLQAKTDGVKIDIVPCYDSDKIISAVDRTPKHNRFLKERLTNQMKKDVVLLKVWLKERNLYGAELKHEGFSGYLCELLVLYYGSFENVVNSIAREWKPSMKIFFTDKYIGPLNDPLVVEDPVDPKRNVASPISLKTLIRTIIGAKLYIEEKKDFFLKEEKKLFENSQRIALKTEKPNINEEILWSQLKTLKNKIVSFLEKNGFEVLKSSCVVLNDEIWLVFDFRSLKISEIQLLKGPGIEYYKDVLEFIRKREYYFVDGKGNLCSFKYREFTDAEKVLENIRKYVKFPKYLDKIWEVKKSVPKQVLYEHYRF
jgi:tRNA nucleotidyltransferase (CCA-adding enzyme)